MTTALAAIVLAGIALNAAWIILLGEYRRWLYPVKDIVVSKTSAEDQCACKRDHL